MNISVIIPVYNAERFLEKAVQSALQFDEVKEIILIEDKSTDNSLEICKKLETEYEKVKLFRHSDLGNHGAGATRNLGLEKATQEFIAFLDADDEFLPNRFDAEKEIFKNEKNDGVFGAIGTNFLTEKGQKEFQKKFSSELTTVNYPAEGKEVFEGLLGISTKTFGTFFHLNALTIKREILGKFNLKFNENLRVHQDSDFIIKLAYHGYLKSGIIDKPVAMRGVHDDNRITKIERYSPKYNERQFLLWKSLYEWAKKNKLPKSYSEPLFLKYKSFEIALKSGFSKYAEILKSVILHPELLKTKYRFTFLNR